VKQENSSLCMNSMLKNGKMGVGNQKKNFNLRSVAGNAQKARLKILFKNSSSAHKKEKLVLYSKSGKTVSADVGEGSLHAKYHGLICIFVYPGCEQCFIHILLYYHFATQRRANKHAGSPLCIKTRNLLSSKLKRLTGGNCILLVGLYIL
jgi:hypothetical protein